MSRVAEQLLAMRSDFEKALEALPSDEERLQDILAALSGVPVNVEVLKQTGIVQVLQGAKKSFGESAMGTKVKNLLAKWKKDCAAVPAQSSSTPSSDSLASSTTSSAPPKVPHAIKVIDANKKVVDNGTDLPTPTIKRCKSEEEEFDDDGYYKALSVIRQKIVKLNAEAFAQSVPNSIANFVATNIESSINALHSADKDQRNYLAKAKTLTFNLKANARLREDVVNGTIPASLLVTLNPKDFATDDVKGARAESTKAATLARRGDLYEITRSEILASNGIDPNKGGEFTCRKCKGTKTSHYSLQTRSSDEPMTVFVCCLNCGNRWRTQ